jgi:hypothetical protein
MQTFLPYPDFQQSVKCLDYRRLGKQRVEARQILTALRGGSKGWVNHPATKMWRGYEPMLEVYLVFCINEWVARGYKNSMPYPDTDYAGRVATAFRIPWWLGNEPFHASHRSNLLRKDPAHYGQFGWSEPPTLEYVWPTP